jgi:5-methylcytosine-specific restriction endonuclease McrA
MFSIITKKQCSKCGEWKSISEFYNDKNSKSGLTSNCKLCVKKARIEWLRKHPDKNRDNERLWAANHPDAVKQRRKRYYEANKEKVKKKSNDWYYKNRSDVIGKASGLARKWYRSHIEKERERKRKEYKANPEKANVRKQNYRARLLKNGGEITATEWRELKKKYNYTCLCCKRREPEIKLTLDHVVPVSLGGRNVIENTQPLCKSCNSSKKARTIDYR